jgi:hypothetical protein
VVYNIQIQSNRIKLLTKYENIIQIVLFGEMYEGKSISKLQWI